jgi:hypothetical protein
MPPPLSAEPAKPEEPKAEDGSLSIQHQEETPPQPLPEEQPPVDDGQIHIDDDGQLKKSWEVEQEKKTEEAPANASDTSDDKTRHKVIAPLNQEPKQEPKTDLRSFDFNQPPAQPFSAAMPEQPAEESFNPLMPPAPGQTETDAGIPGPTAPSSEPEQPALPPAPEPADPMPEFVPPPVMEAPQAPEPVLPELSLPPLPVEPESDTLADIEKAVHSPHLVQQPGEHVDTARNAVMDAINATPYDPAHPEPLQALNANPLGIINEPELPQVQMPDMLQPDAEQASTQDTFPLPDPNAMFASHASSATPQFLIPEQPSPQLPGGMPLHGLGEVLPEGGGNDGTPPPSVPPPMMPM